MSDKTKRPDGWASAQRFPSLEVVYELRAMDEPGWSPPLRPAIERRQALMPATLVVPGTVLCLALLGCLYVAHRLSLADLAAELRPLPAASPLLPNLEEFDRAERQLYRVDPEFREKIREIREIRTRHAWPDAAALQPDPKLDDFVQFRIGGPVGERRAAEPLYLAPRPCDNRDMRHQTRRRVQLHSETLRTLAPEELALVAGGRRGTTSEDDPDGGGPCPGQYSSTCSP